MSDRLVSRLPAISRRVGRRLVAEPAGSRLRRWLLPRVLSAGWAALDERDWNFLERLYSPDVVWRGDGGPLDRPAEIRGWAELRAGIEQEYEVLVTHQVPVEIIDLGGPFFAARVSARQTGVASGIELAQDATYLYETRDGLCMRQWFSADVEQIDGWLTERLAGLDLRDPR